MNLFAVAAVSALIAASSPAQAQPQVQPADLADLQCLGLAAVIAGQSEEGSAEQTGVVAGMMYFLGKLEGRTPGTDWLAELARHVEIWSPEDLQAVAPRCAQEMQVKGQALVDWGTAMQARGQ